MNDLIEIFNNLSKVEKVTVIATLVIGFVFPLVWIITLLTVTVSMLVNANKDTLDGYIKENLVSLLNGDTIIIEEENWLSLNINSAYKVIKKEDIIQEFVWLNKEVNKLFYISLKRKDIESTECILSIYLVH